MRIPKLSPLVPLLAVAATIAGGLTAAPAAQAASIFSVKSCGWKHHTEEFKTPAWWTPRYPGLTVSHQPGRFGLLVITDTATGQEIWSFRQSYAWIWGGYQVRSSNTVLPGHTYRFDYWSDNLAQIEGLCSGDVYLYDKADLQYAGPVS